MIRNLNPQDPQQAQAILDVQIPAYRIEADLIGFDGIPPLHDTVETLAACKETFYGFTANGDGAEGAEELAGVIAVEREGDTLDITRVVVHPDHFRKGIARQMLRFVQETAGDSARVIVRTGARNTPALRLYEQDGFTRIDEIEIAPGVGLAVLEKRR